MLHESWRCSVLLNVTYRCPPVSVGDDGTVCPTATMRFLSDVSCQFRRRSPFPVSSRLLDSYPGTPFPVLVIGCLRPIPPAPRNICTRCFRTRAASARGNDSDDDEMPEITRGAAQVPVPAPLHARARAGIGGSGGSATCFLLDGTVQDGGIRVV